MAAVLFFGRAAWPSDNLCVRAAMANPTGKTILVVEDDDITRAGFGVVLREHGYLVAEAANGKEALDYLRTHPAPNLILLAMFMPVMDGWRFLKHRDAAWAAIPVVIVTTLGVASDDWAASLGACGCLRKPVSVEALLEQVGRCLPP
jgi:CheY-like chemotaxis protein